MADVCLVEKKEAGQKQHRRSSWLRSVELETDSIQTAPHLFYLLSLFFSAFPTSRLLSLSLRPLSRCTHGFIHLGDQPWDLRYPPSQLFLLFSYPRRLLVWQYTGTIPTEYSCCSFGSGWMRLFFCLTTFRFLRATPSPITSSVAMTLAWKDHLFTYRHRYSVQGAYILILATAGINILTAMLWMSHAIYIRYSTVLPSLSPENPVSLPFRSAREQTTLSLSLSFPHVSCCVNG